ncbi:Hint domain-containing protein [Palleronia caenipelagi]|uniref:Hedgehog/Intein (Hint) domain-containing protein n=1 Tax=Palleronia caenipelagi TaxID=2489174 RepID=A0A547Q7T2_9RHOB|nr:Hint domain-containing protein [Palleronia caenipelagi]TRD22442.1 hypothetical protein FEV53_05125 [Palleronia caenipelagi]
MATYTLNNLYRANQLTGSGLVAQGGVTSDGALFEFTYNGGAAQTTTVLDIDPSPKDFQLNDAPQTSVNVNNQKIQSPIVHEVTTYNSGTNLNAEAVYDIEIDRGGTIITATLHALNLGSTAFPREFIYYTSETLQDGDVITYTRTANIDGTIFICFVAGTMIETKAGLKPVETLETGDLVLTKDNGWKPVQWIGKKTVPLRNGINAERAYPVRIKAGALGGDLPERDLYVSQQHRVLVKSKVAERMTGSTEILVPAKKLVGMDGIDLVTDCDEVTYVHFLLDQHEIVYANGAEAESLFTGPEALKAVSRKAREEILELFPELTEMMSTTRVGVRDIPSGKIAKKLVDRIKSNNRALYEV